METTSDAAAILRIREDRGVELGAVVDFTGVAVQDIKIATAVYRALR